MLELDKGQVERPPTSLEGAARDLIVGAYKLDRTLLLVLDSERALDVVSHDENSSLSELHPSSAATKFSVN